MRTGLRCVEVRAGWALVMGCGGESRPGGDGDAGSGGSAGPPEVALAEWQVRATVEPRPVPTLMAQARFTCARP